MNKNYIPLLIMIVLGIMIQSCEKENPPLQEKSQTGDTDNAKVIMGDTLEIPYTVANMQTAFDNLIFNLKKNSKTSKLAKTFKDGDELRYSHPTTIIVFCPRTVWNTIGWSMIPSSKCPTYPCT